MAILRNEGGNRRATRFYLLYINLLEYIVIVASRSVPNY
jgi:hypothetical protein